MATTVPRSSSRCARPRTRQPRHASSGPSTDDALPGLYAAADVFVMPNRSDGVDFEGFGIVFLEAAASGLPSIAGNSGGAPEAVADEQTGLLVDGEDAQQLTAALRRLALSEDLRRRLGSRARERVVTEFTWHHGAIRLANVHQTL